MSSRKPLTKHCIDKAVSNICHIDIAGGNQAPQAMSGGGFQGALSQALMRLNQRVNQSRGLQRLPGPPPAVTTGPPGGRAVQTPFMQQQLAQALINAGQTRRRTPLNPGVGFGAAPIRNEVVRGSPFESRNIPGGSIGRGFSPLPNIFGLFGNRGGPSGVPVTRLPK